MEKLQTVGNLAASGVQNSAPRPRKKLPDAMREAGLDEQSIAQCFAKHIRQLQSKKPPRVPRKLLLDFLKECVRILYAPSRRGDVPEQPRTVELVHFVPRPDRSNDKPPGEGS
jgi:hypothetical protein